MNFLLVSSVGLLLLQFGAVLLTGYKQENCIELEEGITGSSYRMNLGLGRLALKNIPSVEM